jgi:hypothetical protein
MPSSKISLISINNRFSHGKNNDHGHPSLHLELARAYRIRKYDLAVKLSI